MTFRLHLLLFLLLPAVFYAQLTQSWIATYQPSKLKHKLDYGTSIVSDSLGNVYVAGSTDAQRQLFKYDPSGTLLWSKVFPSVDQLPFIIQIDNNNNVVCAYAHQDDPTFLSGADSGIAVISKLDPNGNQLWETTVYTFLGGSLGVTKFYKLLIDSQNNIYALSNAPNATQANVTRLTKIDNAGNKIFSLSYVYAGNPALNCLTGDMLLSKSGNPVVVQHVQLSYSSAKYNMIVTEFNQSGSIMWNTLYSDPANTYTSVAVAKDASGNIYATGYQTVNTGGNTDAITLKLDSSGNILWNKKYGSTSISVNENACAVLAADSGKLFVVGTDLSASKAFVVKYDSLGTKLWAKYYQNTVGTPVTALVAVIDTSDGIYVGGTENTANKGAWAFKCDGDTGLLVWTKVHNVPCSGSCPTSSVAAITLDKNLDLLVTGSTADLLSAYNYSGNSVAQNDNILSIKYAGLSGSQDWKKIVDGTLNCGLKPVTIVNNNATVPTLLLNASGNGNKPEASSTYRFTTTWIPTTLQNKSRNASVMSTNYNVSQAHNYSTGYASASATTDAILLDYVDMGLGTYDYKVLYDGTAHSNDEGYEVTTDTINKNTYVAGYSTNLSTGVDMMILKYRPYSYLVKTYNGTANDSDIAVSITRDASGFIYVAGHTTNSGTGKDITTLKLDTACNLIWARIYNGTLSMDDYASTIKLDGSGNVFVLGTINNSGSGKDVALLKYDPSGSLQWAQVINGTAGQNDFAVELEVDSAGNAYVLSTVLNLTTSQDYALAKYSAVGNQMWLKTFSGGTGSYDEAIDLAIDKLGYSYVAGITSTTTTKKDITTLMYDTNGNLISNKTFNDSLNKDDVPVKINLDRYRRLYVAGSGIDSVCSTSYLVGYCPKPPAPQGFLTAPTTVCAYGPNVYQIIPPPVYNPQSAWGDYLFKYGSLNTYTNTPQVQFGFLNANSTDTLYAYYRSACGALSDPIKVVVHVKVSPNVVVNPNWYSTCAGQPVAMYGQGATSYTWSPNAGSVHAATATVSPAVPTSYTVTGEINGCFGTATATVTIKSVPTITFSPFIPDTVCASTNLISLSASPSGGTYAGTGVSGNYFYPGVAGVGTHTIYYTSPTTSNACSTTDSIQIVVMGCLTVASNAASKVLVFPNPFHDKIYLTNIWPGSEIYLYDATGELIQIIQTTGNEIDLSFLASGLYFIEVRSTSNIRERYRLVKD